MRLGIVGSREFLDYSLLAATVDSFVEKTKIKVEKIVSGGAKGADSLAARYASEHGYPLQEFKPDYGKYGRGAPLKRNTDIVENSDIILAFVTASSRGTLGHHQEGASEEQNREDLQRLSPFGDSDSPLNQSVTKQKET